MTGFSRGLDGVEISTAGMAAIPNSDTSFLALGKNAKVKAFIISNPTAGAIDITIKQGAATGGTTIIFVSIPAKSVQVLPGNGATDFDGIILKNGASWAASASGMFGEIIGFKQS